MRKLSRVVLAGTAVLAIALIVITAIALMSGEDSPNVVNASEVANDARSEKEQYVRGVLDGDIFFYRNVIYRKDRLPFPEEFGLQALPDRIVSHLWMAANPDGTFRLYEGATYSPEGELLHTSRTDRDSTMITNAETGQTWDMPGGGIGDSRLDDWVEGIFAQLLSLEEEGFEPVGSGNLNGAASTIFENNVTAGESSYVRRVEAANENPLIYKISVWQEDENGEPVLEQEMEILEVSILPADTPVEPVPSIQPLS